MGAWILLAVATPSLRNSPGEGRGRMPRPRARRCPAESLGDRVRPARRELRPAGGELAKEVEQVARRLLDGLRESLLDAPRPVREVLLEAARGVDRVARAGRSARVATPDDPDEQAHRPPPDEVARIHHL